MENIEIKVGELIEKLSQFNKDAKAVINVKGERYNINGIWSWSATGDGKHPEVEKLSTPQVTLSCELSDDLEEIENKKYDEIKDNVLDILSTDITDITITLDTNFNEEELHTTTMKLLGSLTTILRVYDIDIYDVPSITTVRELVEFIFSKS